MPHTLQSERLLIHIKNMHKSLIDKGLAYPDLYTKEEVDQFREQAELG